VVDLADVSTLVDDLVRTSRGDFNLDRRVDGADFLLWQRGLGSTGARFDQGNANLDGAVNGADLTTWRATYGVTAPLALATTAAVPEPSAIAIALTAAAACRCRTRRHSTRGMVRG
jgi:hypothetical protein